MKPPPLSEDAKKSPAGYVDLGYARVDQWRQKRKGFPEVIYGEGKTAEQILGIAKVLSPSGPLLITRLEQGHFAKLRKALPRLHYHALAHCAFSADPALFDRLGLSRGRQGKVIPLWGDNPTVNGQDAMGHVLIVTAGTLDLPCSEEAALTAAMLGCRVTRLPDVGVAGLHRLLDKAHLLGQADALVVAAGMDAALASVVTGLTDRPVIGLPTPVGYGHGGRGEAGLSAMLQACSPGLTVVNIGNGFGAGFAAGQIALRSALGRKG